MSNWAELSASVWDWEGWRLVTIFACMAGLVGSLTFVASFQAKVGWSWWRQPNGQANPFGRYLMINSLLVFCLLSVILSNRVLEDWPPRLAVTTILMSMFAAQTFVPFGLLIMISASESVNTDAAMEDDMTVHPTDPAEIAGPRRDGSMSLARESKFGQATTFLTTGLALILWDVLGGLDTEGLPAWAEGTVTAAIGTAMGLLSAYITRNRRR